MCGKHDERQATNLLASQNMCLSGSRFWTLATSSDEDEAAKGSQEDETTLSSKETLQDALAAGYYEMLYQPLPHFPSASNTVCVTTVILIFYSTLNLLVRKYPWYFTV